MSEFESEHVRKSRFPQGNFQTATPQVATAVPPTSWTGHKSRVGLLRHWEMEGIEGSAVGVLIGVLVGGTNARG